MLNTAPILEARELTRSFGGFVAVQNVNLKIKPGTIHALIGPNGAGKSTLFNLLTKFLPPSSGRIFFKDQDITSMAPADIARLRLVRSFQISSVFPHLSARENVRVALQARERETFAFWKSNATLRRFNEEATALLESVGLADRAQAKASELSYGRKRALELATTLALDPEVLLLDEPMAGMGTEDIGRTAALIRSVGKGRTVLMVEHNLGVVADLSDRITVLRRGEIIAEGTYSDVSSNSEVRKAYMGGAHG
ncbi:ABC transporter ATP-binding protein [Pararhizobium sp. LjRoot255]|uniref:ABC transporter ATP-binding protein n=1 Tax=Pararhizobium sp. LjRoot255 TaxID=3342298 RepID=UPI003ECCA780